MCREPDSSCNMGHLFPPSAKIRRSLVLSRLPASLTHTFIPYPQVFFTVPQLFFQILQKKSWKPEFKASPEPQLLPLQPQQVQLSARANCCLNASPLPCTPAWCPLPAPNCSPSFLAGCFRHPSTPQQSEGGAGRHRARFISVCYVGLQPYGSICPFIAPELVLEAEERAQQRAFRFLWQEGISYS